MEKFHTLLKLGFFSKTINNYTACDNIRPYDFVGHFKQKSMHCRTYWASEYLDIWILKEVEFYPGARFQSGQSSSGAEFLSEQSSSRAKFLSEQSSSGVKFQPGKSSNQGLVPAGAEFQPG